MGDVREELVDGEDKLCFSCFPAEIFQIVSHGRLRLFLNIGASLAKP